MKYYDEKIETMSREEIEKLQLDRLREMVDYCIERVPFYKEKFETGGGWKKRIPLREQITSLKDISKLPFTTKHDLQNQYPCGLLAVPMSEVVRVHATSGTTGKPKIAFYTKKDMEIWTDMVVRDLRRNGITKEDIVQNAFSYSLFSGGFGFHQAAEEIGCTVIPASAGNTQKQIVMMKDLGVTVVMATPSYAVYLSEAISRLAIPISEFKIRKVLVAGERCTKSMRKVIEKNLNAEVIDGYGITECLGLVSGECSCHDGLHVAEDIYYPEVINPATGEVMPDGEQGELVFTSLYREAMPLLRYRTGDITILTHEKCRCGRTSARMQAPFARADDMLVFKGVNLYPSQIEYAIDGIEGLSPHYHIRLERENNLDKMTLNVEMMKPLKCYSDQEIEKMKETIQQRVRDLAVVRMKIELYDPDTLQRFEGKARRVEDLRYRAEEE